MNRFGSRFKPLLWFMALLLAAFVAGCGSGGGGETDSASGADGGGGETGPGQVVVAPPNQSLTVLSPVIGPMRVTGTENPDCVGVAGLWTFCQHKTGSPDGFHRPGGGVSGSDDTFAWDANLRADADDGQNVFAVAVGRVVRYGGIQTPGGGAGAVLIEHIEGGITWWSGYLHMTDIQVLENQKMTTSTVLGRIGNVCAACGSIPNHLHFVVYAGSNTRGGLISRNAEITER